MRTVTFPHYKRLIRDIVEDEDGHVYQGIKLTHYENSIEDVKYQYASVINLIENIPSRFSNFQDTAVFRNIVRLLRYKNVANCTRFVVLRKRTGRNNRGI